MSSNAYKHSLWRRVVMLAALGGPAVAWPALATPRIPNGPFNLLVGDHRADVPVSGRVTQANGTGLPGVTVVVKGTTLGTSTGADGSFSLNVPEGSTLVVSSVGFIKKEVPLSGATTSLVISLVEDRQALSEIVVVGYGTQERGSVTGAISSVNGAELVRQPVADATQAIQGKVSGVTITSNGGAPGGAAGTSVRIRGITSAGNNSPLYVLDGFPLPDGSDSQINAISPNDIETIDVLKDASATAIYGVRAANGVVIITTKRGKAGRTTFNLDAYRGVQVVARKLNLLNAQEYATINNESLLAAGKPIALDKLRDPASLGKGTDWQDLLFRRAKIQNYSVSTTGGSEKARYALSGTYFQQDGIILGSNFERFTLRANGDVQIGKILKLGNNISLTHLSDRQVSSNGGGNGGNNEYGAVQQLLRMPPTVQPYRPDGYWYQPNSANDNFTEENPLATSQRVNQRFTRNRALTTFFAELEPVKGLRFRTNVGADFIFENFNSFAPRGPELTGYTQRYITAGATATSRYAPSYLIENTATLDRLFADKHQVTLLLGQSAQQFSFSNVEAYRSQYLRNDLQVINAGPINTLLNNAGTLDPPRRLASYFGRLNYEFGGKYIFQATVRYDGSSRFQVGEKFGFFPGASAGWRISEEDFLKGNSTISNLKLRVGYGRVGNELNAGRYAYLSSINFGITYPLGADGAINTGGAPTRLRNPDLRWEYNDQANVGIDLGFLDNRFEASIDLYNRNSPNLIAPVPPSLVSGTYESVNRNAASAYNRGIDVGLTSHNFAGTDQGLTWTTTFNISAYKTRLEKLGVGVPYNGLGSLSGTIVRYDVNQAFGSFYGYVADGLIQTQEELNTLNAGANVGNPKNDKFYQTNGTAPGDIKFRDLNGDGVITDADRKFIGNPNPNLTFGLTNNLAYKGFDLSFFIQGVQGNDVYNLNRYITESALYSTTNGTTRILNRWTGPGTSNDVPRAINGDPNNNLRVSTHFIEDGSYVRLKNLTFGYTLPKSIMDRISATQLRVYFTAQNLITLTKYTGYDPEVSASGVDLGIYPQARVFMGGLNIGF
ncbi:TonB-dependent receptor [Hymenobacter sp. GOD-10R]|uniref:SusC/RagA family TonB-linked outer membrane protein n=1 Tax=Hymenobacter sp. GOD-10R TaxID=3093922 RepID=UPI002D76EF8A|nr:TonB-dependent receptor [Hymenobacter sp. GOD-10R]WRQ26808.1 TonB-dependent receptor [Hymenobacter sp. GOD-10R]